MCAHRDQYTGHMKKTTKRTDTPPSWDLSGLYAGVDDPQITLDLKQALNAALAFEKTYRGKLAGLADTPSGFLKAVRAYERLSDTLESPLTYAMLHFSTKTDDPARGALMARVQKEATEIMSHALFFDSELSNIETKKLKALADSAELASIKNWLRKTIDWQPHQLAERDEELLMRKGLTGGSAFSRLYEERESARVFSFRGKKLHESEILQLARHPNRATRKLATEGFSRGLMEDLKLNAFIFNTIAADHLTNNTLRKLPSAEAPRNMANQASQQMVDALRAAVESSYPLAQRYFKWKKRALKVDKLMDYDRYAPLPGSDKTWSWNETKKIVLEAYQAFSPEFGALAQEFFDKKWIDASLKPGKRGGAFCQFGSPKAHPYVLVNFTGTNRDVTTLAHELGHGIHACLMRAQTIINYSPPMTVAETASIFGEMITYEKLLAVTNDKKARRALLAEMAEGIYGSVFVQIGYDAFERKYHEGVRAKGELSPDEFNTIWKTEQQRLNGKAVTMSPGSETRWSSIPHFVEHTPFYVYAYAFGKLLTLALVEIYREQGKAFVADYTEMLRAGSSKSPQELVAPFGVRLDDPKFWKRGLRSFEKIIEELEKTG